MRFVFFALFFAYAHELLLSLVLIMNPTEYVALLNNNLVAEALQNIFKPLIQLTIDELIKPLERTFSACFGELNATIKMLQLDINFKQQHIFSLEENNKLFTDKIKQLEVNLDDIEQYSRKENLVISGIPSSFAEAGGTGTSESSQSTIDKVIDVFNTKLGL